MLQKTRAVVLHYLKFGESSIIAHLFTENYGRKTLIIKGVRGRKTRMKANLIQPLFLLDVEYYQKEQQEMQLMKEFSLAYNFTDFPYDVKKSTQALFIAEVLYKTLRQEEPDQNLFDFLIHSITYFDLQQEGSANFHLLFLVKLTRFLGILPLKESEGKQDIFDIREGRFQSDIPFHFHFLDPSSAGMLANLLNMNYEAASAFRLSHVERNNLLNEILRFYSFHHYHVDNLKSIRVLKEIFR